MGETPVSENRFSSYDDFFAFYLEQHSNPANRLLHACGTFIGLSVLISAVITRHYWWALLWIPIGYGFAWIGHFVIEGNKPATFGHPWWSFISDFRMVGLMLTGKMNVTASAKRGPQT